MIDSTVTNAAELAAFVGAAVELAKPYVPATPSKAANLRTLSAVLGAVVVAAAELSAPGASLTASGVFGAVAQGLALGAGVTVAYKGAQVATTAAKRVSFKKAATPDPSPLLVTPTTSDPAPLALTPGN